LPRPSPSGGGRGPFLSPQPGDLLAAGHGKKTFTIPHTNDMHSGFIVNGRRPVVQTGREGRDLGEPVFSVEIEEL
jgi:hypothetical protein